MGQWSGATRAPVRRRCDNARTMIALLATIVALKFVEGTGSLEFDGWDGVIGAAVACWLGGWAAQAVMAWVLAGLDHPRNCHDDFPSNCLGRPDWRSRPSFLRSGAGSGAGCGLRLPGVHAEFSYRIRPVIDQFSHCQIPLAQCLIAQLPHSVSVRLWTSPRV